MYHTSTFHLLLCLHSLPPADLHRVLPSRSMRPLSPPPTPHPPPTHHSSHHHLCVHAEAIDVPHAPKHEDRFHHSTRYGGPPSERGRVVAAGLAAAAPLEPEEGKSPPYRTPYKYTHHATITTTTTHTHTLHPGPLAPHSARAGLPSRPALACFSGGGWAAAPTFALLGAAAVLGDGLEAAQAWCGIPGRALAEQEGQAGKLDPGQQQSACPACWPSSPKVATTCPCLHAPSQQGSGRGCGRTASRRGRCNWTSSGRWLGARSFPGAGPPTAPRTGSGSLFRRRQVGRGGARWGALPVWGCCGVGGSKRPVVPVASLCCLACCQWRSKGSGQLSLVADGGQVVASHSHAS